MHTPHPTPLYPLAISYRNYQKSPAYFSYLAPLVLFFFTERQSQKGACKFRGLIQALPRTHESADSGLRNTGLNGRHFITSWDFTVKF